MNKMERKHKPEWLMLDVIYGIGMIIYILAQIFILGGVSDLIFIVMLSAATIFLNYRQQNLYNSLVRKENEKLFGEDLLQKKFENNIEELFLKRCDNYLALVFAVLFAVVMWHFEVWNNCIELKFIFSVYLFVANIPTGYAIIRILKYFYYNTKWIENIKIDFGVHGGFQERFIKRICMKVLFTAVVYCTLSLSSILFTQIQLNAIVVLYTLFAMMLVIISLSLTSILLKKRVRDSNIEIVEAINLKIATIIVNQVESEESNEAKLQKMKELQELKEYILREEKSRVNFGKLASYFGLLFITVIPIILQWLLDRLA